MTKGLLDDQKIDFPCPECSRKVAARVGQLKRSPTLRCPAGHSFDVDAKQLARDLKKIDQAIANFPKTLKF
jgi:uncharacterized Zn finger protein